MYGVHSILVAASFSIFNFLLLIMSPIYINLNDGEERESCDSCHLGVSEYRTYQAVSNILLGGCVFYTELVTLRYLMVLGIGSVDEAERLRG